MLPAIGLIVAAYAIGRLIQVPIEHSGISSKWVYLLIVSVPAIIVIGLCVVDLVLGGMRVNNLPNLPR